MENEDNAIGRALGAYEIGRKLKQLRLRKKIGLADLGKHTGLSASMLSQLENGKMAPTLPTLVRIAMVFDVGLEHFFENRSKKVFAVIRARERMRFPDRPDSPDPSFFFECLAYSAQAKGMQAYLAEFPARKSGSAEHVHDGSEFVLVLSGALGIRFEKDERVLEAGDSVYFDASEPHSYRGAATETSRAVVVTVPPRL